MNLLLLNKPEMKYYTCHGNHTNFNSSISDTEFAYALGSMHKEKKMGCSSLNQLPTNVISEMKAFS